MKSAGFVCLSLVLPALVAGAGCQDRLYQFTGTIAPTVDAGATDATTVDRSPDRAGGSGGAGGAGGTGGSGGAGGAGGSSAGGTGGGLVICSDSSPERQTDIANCGRCFNLCIAPNSTPACVSGACQFTCLVGFFDADGNMANGCECVKNNGGVEACDGLDNDCDGTVDEGFDFNTDLAHCGGCNKPCFYPFAAASCTGGICAMGACSTGYYDRDSTVPGCETACAKTNGGVEICDGMDNDCNGVVDDNPGAPTITCKTRGVCAGVAPACMGQTGWVCSYPSTYQGTEDTAMGCDGRDNDCDGSTDEAFDIGKSCVVGSGPCAGTGTWVCNAGGTAHTCQGSMRTPGTETCNGQDDDCDGKIDELDTLSDRTSDDKIVYFSGKNVTMFVHEASRYDGNGTSAGFDSTRRPCSVAGKQPWSNVTKEEAETACERIGTGWRLCTAAEWADACNGSGNTTFPYGNTYDGTKCNGYDYPKTAGVTTLGAGAASACISDLSAAANDELYDMSGNVKEWVLTTTTTTGPFELRGGAYNVASFSDGTVMPAVTRAPGLQCDATTPAPTQPVRLPSVGFRCCKTGMMAP